MKRTLDVTKSTMELPGRAMDDAGTKPVTAALRPGPCATVNPLRGAEKEATAATRQAAITPTNEGANEMPVSEIECIYGNAERSAMECSDRNEGGDIAAGSVGK